jgi:FtsP/CotA-like multicopper oxidase with cupredoxin domain
MMQGEREGHTLLGLSDHFYQESPLELHARVGETEIWTIENLTEYDHPFHLHGFRFQVLDRAGVAPSLAEWKDTLNIPARSQARLAVHFDDRPGMWMLHCHILEHAGLGMMGMLHLSHH